MFIAGGQVRITINYERHHNHHHHHHRCLNRILDISYKLRCQNNC